MFVQVGFFVFGGNVSCFNGLFGFCSIYAKMMVFCIFVVLFVGFIKVFLHKRFMGKTICRVPDLFHRDRIGRHDGSFSNTGSCSQVGSLPPDDAKIVMFSDELNKRVRRMCNSREERVVGRGILGFCPFRARPNGKCET